MLKNETQKNKRFVLKVNKISKNFDEKRILNNISFSLYFGEKIALIGANGSGKSTLSKIITGELKPDTGEIEVFKNFSISYLPQEINNNVYIYEYLEENSKTFSLLEEFSLTKGNFKEFFKRKISSFSGGEKTKIFLIKISLEKSPIIILDEPTNNLDYEGLTYLENIINNSKSAFLIISHDRNFLDNTVSKIIFLDEFSHTIKTYDGNYSTFLELKKQENERTSTLFGENQRKKKKIETEINNLQSRASVNKRVSFSNDNDKYIDFNKTARNLKKNSKRLKATKNKLENFEEKENINSKRPLKINFSDMETSSKKILELKNLFLTLGSGKEISLEILAKDRIQISGKNGTGKSTFLKTILKYKKENNFENLNILKDKDTEINWGVNVNLGYLPQDLTYGKEDEIFLDYFMKKTEKEVSDARKILARFGFADSEIQAKISELSPGMKSRGKIALMIANNPNVLILDEPTNNLDLEVLEKLEQALENYQGTIIFISHDKYFIDKIKPNKNFVLE